MMTSGQSSCQTKDITRYSVGENRTIRIKKVSFYFNQLRVSNQTPLSQWRFWTCQTGGAQPQYFVVPNWTKI